MKNSIELYKHLASQGIRLFNITINDETSTFIHSQKTVEEWRKDVKQILNSLKIDDEVNTENMIFADIQGRLNLLGYYSLNEIVSDVYEGEIKIKSAEIVDYIDHEGQVDGFGHYGTSILDKTR